ncbi:MAG: hypothetical protein LRZ94_01150 [Candidatus Pacebacteria bacterium]|nr:hypothetical protein [Candidatus Paceibacterota bacterium]
MAKQPITYTHSLICVKKHHKFSIDSEEENNTKIGVDKIRCPFCQSPVQLDIQFVSTKPSFESQRALNIEATKEAYKMASEQKKIDIEINPEITVSPPAGVKGQPFQVPKRVVDKIREKVAPSLNKLLQE